jgi:hypothetical protein
MSLRHQGNSLGNERRCHRCALLGAEGCRVLLKGPCHLTGKCASVTGKELGLLHLASRTPPLRLGAGNLGHMQSPTFFQLPVPSAVLPAAVCQHDDLDEGT